jgi:hypothetical protein
MKDEITFNGSPLETEIRNTRDYNKLEKLHQLTKSAFENQTNSIFWKEAFKMIDKKHKTK